MNIESVCREVRENGACHVSSFLSQDRLEEIEREYDSLFSLIPDFHEAHLNENENENGPRGSLILESAANYKSGKHLRVSPNAYSAIPSLITIFNTQDFKSLVDMYLGTPNEFCMQIFMSNEFKVIEEGSFYRNQYLHFDPYASLKFFLYLSDTDDTTGATFYIPGSRETGKHYREHRLDLNDSTGLYGGTRHRLEDYPGPVPYSKKDAVPILGKKGDLLILDTDTLHYGGVLKAPSNRKVIILHNRPA